MKCPDAISTVPGIALTDFPNRKAKISAEMMSAASKIGFFYVTGKYSTPDLTPPYPLVEEMCGAGHGLAQADIDAAFAMSVRSA